MGVRGRGHCYVAIALFAQQLKLRATAAKWPFGHSSRRTEPAARAGFACVGRSFSCRRGMESQHNRTLAFAGAFDGWLEGTIDRASRRSPQALAASIPQP